MRFPRRALLDGDFCAEYIYEKQVKIESILLKYTAICDIIYSEKLYLRFHNNTYHAHLMKESAKGRIAYEKDRLVYHLENGRVYIAHCKGHYDDK